MNSFSWLDWPFATSSATWLVTMDTRCPRFCSQAAQSTARALDPRTVTFLPSSANINPSMSTMSTPGVPAMPHDTFSPPVATMSASGASAATSSGVTWVSSTTFTPVSSSWRTR